MTLADNGLRLTCDLQYDPSPRYMHPRSHNNKLIQIPEMTPVPPELINVANQYIDVFIVLSRNDVVGSKPGSTPMTYGPAVKLPSQFTHSLRSFSLFLI